MKPSAVVIGAALTGATVAPTAAAAANTANANFFGMFVFSHLTPSLN